MEQQINTFLGGIDTDTAYENMNPSTYLDARDITVLPSEANELSRIMAALPMANIPLPTRLSKPRLRAFRIELDYSTTSISHKFTFIGGSTTPYNFTVSSTSGTLLGRYNDLVAQIRTQVDVINDGIPPTVTSFYPQSVFVLTFTDTTDEITGTQIIGSQSEKVIDIVQEVVQSTSSQVKIAALKSFGDNLFAFFDCIDTGLIAVSKKDESTGVWTTTRLIESKEFTFDPNRVINLKIDRNGDFLNLYWVDGVDKPKTLVIPYQETWVQDSALKYTVSNPVTPVGLYTYNQLSTFTNLQIFNNTPNISNVTVNDTGGGLKSGNVQFSLQFNTGGGYTDFSVLSDIVPITVRSVGEFIGGGGSPNSATSKSVTLDLRNMPFGLFSSYRIAIITFTGGARSAITIGDFPLVSESFSVTVTGLENPQSLDYAAAFADKSFAIKTAHLNEIVENKYFLGRIEVETDPNVQNWVENTMFASSNISIVAHELDGVGTYVSRNPNGEYMSYVNCQKYVGYMYNELYRIGVRFYLKNGYITKTYYGADVLISNDITGKLGNLTNSAATKVYAYAPRLNAIDFSTAPDIDGVPFMDAVEAFEIMRVECVPDVIDTGYVLLADGESSVSGNVYRYVGNELSFFTGIISPVDRKQLGFISQSILASGDSIINNTMKIRSYVTGSSLLETGNATNPSYLYSEFSGYFSASPTPNLYDIDVAIMNPFSQRSLIAIDGSGVKNWIDGGVNNSNSAWRFGNNSPMVAMLTNADVLPITGGTVDANAYYAQIYLGLSNDRYGDKYSSQYISTGEFDILSKPNWANYIIFGGDTFTQKCYQKTAYNGYDNVANKTVRCGVSYYAQNRFNAQMGYCDSPTQFVYPLNTQSDDLVEWLQSSVDAEPRKYDAGFTPMNNTRVSASYNPNLPSVTKLGTTVIFSDEKLENDLFDAYRVFRFNNQKTYETSDGLLTGMYRVRENLVLLQEYALRSQPVSPNITISTQDATSTIIGTGSVLGTKEIVVTRMGATLKTHSCFYQASNGSQYVAYFDSMSKKVLRYGIDGIKLLSDDNKTRTFFLNNTQFIQDEFDLIMYYDPSVEQLQISANVIGNDVGLYDGGATYNIGDKVVDFVEYPNSNSKTIFKSLINDNQGEDLETAWYAWEEYLNSNFNIGFNERFNNFSTRYSYKPRLATTYMNKAVLAFPYSTNSTSLTLFLAETGVQGGSGIPLVSITPRISFTVAKQPNLFKRFLKSWINIDGGAPSMVVAQSDDGTASQVNSFTERRGRYLFNINNDYFGTNQRVGGNKFKVTIYFGIGRKIHNFVSSLIYKDRKFNS